MIFLVGSWQFALRDRRIAVATPDTGGPNQSDATYQADNQYEDGVEEDRLLRKNSAHLRDERYKSSANPGHPDAMFFRIARRRLVPKKCLTSVMWADQYVR